MCHLGFSFPLPYSKWSEICASVHTIQVLIPDCKCLKPGCVYSIWDDFLKQYHLWPYTKSPVIISNVQSINQRFFSKWKQFWSVHHLISESFNTFETFLFWPQFCNIESFCKASYFCICSRTLILTVMKLLLKFLIVFTGSYLSCWFISLKISNSNNKCTGHVF